MRLETTNTKIEKQRNYLIGSTFLLEIFSFLAFNLSKLSKDRNDKIAFTEALTYVQKEERKRITRDLEDGVGPSLLFLKKQLIGNHQAVLENQRLIKDTLEEVGAISEDLYPF